MVTIDMAPTALASVMLETMVYGIFLVLCIKSLSVLKVQELWQSKDVNRLMLLVTLTFLTSITAHWILQCQVIFQAFIVASNTPYGTTIYLANSHSPVYLTLESLYMLVSVLADFFITYRTYIVWARNPWMIVLPTLMTIALAITSTGVVVELAITPLYSNHFTSSIKPWIISSLSLTLCTNLWCSASITYRIWQGQKSLMEHGDGLDRLAAMTKKLSRTLHVFVESAALFTIITLAALVCYLMQTILVFVMIDLAVPIVGICFCSIIVCVGGNVDDSKGEFTSVTFGNTSRSRQGDCAYVLPPMNARTSKSSLHDDSVAFQLA